MNFLSGITGVICSMDWDELKSQFVSDDADAADRVTELAKLSDAEDGGKVGFESFIEQFKDKLQVDGAESGEGALGKFDISRAMELFKGGCGNFGDLFSMMKDLPSPDKLKDLLGSGRF